MVPNLGGWSILSVEIIISLSIFKNKIRGKTKK